jgi:hypothetical protein
MAARAPKRYSARGNAEQAREGTASPLRKVDGEPPIDDVELLAWLAEQESIHRALIHDAWKTILGARAPGDWTT